MTQEAAPPAGSPGTPVTNPDRVVIVADCDHPSIAIEQGVLADVCKEIQWLAYKREDELIAR